MPRGGPPRIEAWEPGQIGNEAAITKYLKCRGQARHIVIFAPALLGVRMPSDFSAICARRRTRGVLMQRARRHGTVSYAGYVRACRKFFIAPDVNDNPTD